VPLTTIAVVLIVIVALVWFGQRSMMYFPASDVGSPHDAGLARAEPVEFMTEDQLELGAWFVPPAGPPSGYTVIVFNGNAGHRGYRATLAQRLAERGMAVLLFDYRGYGGNPGLPHEQGLARDARAALSYVRSRPDVDSRRIVFFGESLGTAVAVALAVDYAPAALVLRSPFTSFKALARMHYPFIPLTFLLRDRYDSLSLIARVTSPVLVIAGTSDRIVPLEDSEALFEHARDPKRLVTIQDADHNDDVLVEGPGVIDEVVQWLQ